MGLMGEDPFHDARSWVRYMISPQGVSLERLEAEQIVFALPDPTYRKYREKGFATPSGKVEFASLWFESQGAGALPDDAAARRIREGDAVEAASPHGKINLKAHICEDAAQGLAFIDFGWGNPSDGKANINDLTDDQRFDPYSGGTPNRLFPCEIRLLGGKSLPS